MLICASLSPSDPSVASSVETLGKIFPIVLALALGEAFKQLVAEKPDKARKVFPERLWSLVGFLALLVPFFHGMSRHFFETYVRGRPPDPYPLYLAIDTLGFTGEAGLLFVLSRSLDPSAWRRFYLTVLILLGFDILWGVFVGWQLNPQIYNWALVNTIALPVIGLFVMLAWRRPGHRTIVAIGACLLVLRGGFDYKFNWRFYFPPQVQAENSPATREGAGVTKPIIYIASPYTKGDVAMNTHFQCKVFDQLLTDGRVWPVAPLWSHFQHTLFPRPYKDWIAYDQAMLPRYDACLRLTARLDSMHYEQHESTGADNEVATFERLGKPVFTSIEELYRWVDEQRSQPLPTTRG